MEKYKITPNGLEVYSKKYNRKEAEKRRREFIKNYSEYLRRKAV